VLAQIYPDRAFTEIPVPKTKGECTSGGVFFKALQIGFQADILGLAQIFKPRAITAEILGAGQTSDDLRNFFVGLVVGYHVIILVT
jgi:hypothetical protein